MQLDLHVWRFDWAGSPAGIGPGLADLALRAESIGVNTLSLMDHFFRMEAMAPADDPMLEGYTALGFIAGTTERLRLHLLVTGVTYRHPGLLAKTVTTARSTASTTSSPRRRAGHSRSAPRARGSSSVAVASARRCASSPGTPTRATSSATPP